MHSGTWCCKVSQDKCLVFTQHSLPLNLQCDNTIKSNNYSGVKVQVGHLFSWLCLRERAYVARKHGSNGWWNCSAVWFSPSACICLLREIEKFKKIGFGSNWVKAIISADSLEVTCWPVLIGCFGWFIYKVVLVLPPLTSSQQWWHITTLWSF